MSIFTMKQGKLEEELPLASVTEQAGVFLSEERAEAIRTQGLTSSSDYKKEITSKAETVKSSIKSTFLSGFKKIFQTIAKTIKGLKPGEDNVGVFRMLGDELAETVLTTLAERLPEIIAEHEAEIAKNLREEQGLNVDSVVIGNNDGIPPELVAKMDLIPQRSLLEIDSSLSTLMREYGDALEGPEKEAHNETLLKMREKVARSLSPEDLSAYITKLEATSPETDAGELTTEVEDLQTKDSSKLNFPQ